MPPPADQDAGSIVLAYYRALDERDAAAVIALFAEDGTSEDAPYGVPVGRLRLSQTLPAFFDAYPSLRYACRSLIVDGQTVAAEYEVTNSATADDWRLRGAAIFELNSGSIVRHTAYWDEKTYARGLRRAE